MGFHNWQEEEYGDTFEVKRISMHQRFSQQYFMANDIALLELTDPIMFNIEASPICLPERDVPVGHKCFITGKIVRCNLLKVDIP